MLRRPGGMFPRLYRVRAKGCDLRVCVGGDLRGDLRWDTLLFDLLLLLCLIVIILGRTYPEFLFPLCAYFEPKRGN